MENNSIKTGQVIRLCNRCNKAVLMDPRSGYYEKGHGICVWCGCPEYRIEPLNEKHITDDDEGSRSDGEVGDERTGSDVQGEGERTKAAKQPWPRVRRANDHPQNTDEK